MNSARSRRLDRDDGFGRVKHGDLPRIAWYADLTLALEGDSFIERESRNAAPGESSAPAHTDGGAAYVRYQLTPRDAVASRAEYMSDRGGLFSGITQALKENTFTLDCMMAHGFLTRYEWRSRLLESGVLPGRRPGRPDETAGHGDGGHHLVVGRDGRRVVILTRFPWGRLSCKTFSGSW